MVPDDDDDEPKKTPRATIIRRVLVGLLALACAFGWIYTRYLVKKGTLGDTCSYDMHCRAEAPRCLKQSVDEDGVCSHSCETDADCAERIKCVKVELEDRDDRGRPLEGGYCFPQSLLDARKKKGKKDGGANATSASAEPPIDSWLEIPESASQLEAEISIDPDGGSAGRPSMVVEVKGSLLRAQKPSKRGRTIVDTSTLRVYAVDDDKKTFSASQLAAGSNELRITKTDRTDRVADRDCEIWQVDETGKPAREACVIKGASFLDPSARMASALEKELSVRAAFPLRITEGGKTKLLVTKIDAHPLPASAFAIPKTYRNLAAH